MMLFLRKLAVLFCVLFPIAGFATSNGIYEVRGTFQSPSESVDYTGVATYLKFQDRHFIMTAAHIGCGAKISILTQNLLNRSSEGHARNSTREWTVIPEIHRVCHVLSDLAVIEVEPAFAKSQLSSQFQISDLNAGTLLPLSPLIEVSASELKLQMNQQIEVAPQLQISMLLPKNNRSEFTPSTTCPGPKMSLLLPEFEFCGVISPGMSGAPLIRPTQNSNVFSVAGVAKQYDSAADRSYGVSRNEIGKALSEIIRGGIAETDSFQLEVENAELIRASETLGVREFVASVTQHGSLSWVRKDSGRGGSRADGGDPIGSNPHLTSTGYQYLKSGQVIKVIRIDFGLKAFATHMSQLKRFNSTNSSNDLDSLYLLPDLTNRSAVDKLLNVLKQPGVRIQMTEMTNLPDLAELLQSRLANSNESLKRDFHSRLHASDSSPDSLSGSRLGSRSDLRSVPRPDFTLSSADGMKLQVSRERFKLSLVNLFGSADESAELVFDSQSFSPVMTATTHSGTRIYIDLRGMFYFDISNLTQAANSNSNSSRGNPVILRQTGTSAILRYESSNYGPRSIVTGQLNSQLQVSVGSLDGKRRTDYVITTIGD